MKKLEEERVQRHERRAIEEDRYQVDVARRRLQEGTTDVINPVVRQAPLPLQTTTTTTATQPVGSTALAPYPVFQQVPPLLTSTPLPVESTLPSRQHHTQHTQQPLPYTQQHTQQQPQHQPQQQQPSPRTPRTSFPPPSASDVGRWLSKLGYEEYYERFMTNGFDKMEAIALLDVKDIESLNITLAGHRKGLIAAVMALQAKNLEGF